MQGRVNSGGRRGFSPNPPPPLTHTPPPGLPDGEHDAWTNALAKSDVRLQWDPDHDPLGRNLERRAIQLGLSGEMLRRYGESDLISIEDITPFVIGQRQHLKNSFAGLQTPCEQIYHPRSTTAALAAGIDL